MPGAYVFVKVGLQLLPTSFGLFVGNLGSPGAEHARCRQQLFLVFLLFLLLYLFLHWHMILSVPRFNRVERERTTHLRLKHNGVGQVALAIFTIVPGRVHQAHA
jgi:nitric oxide reductase large subunit